MDMVIIRENEEDLYAGIEHRQTDETYQCLKLVTRSGCERIVRYAFEYALINGRKKVTCMTKDNIMKLTDGLFHKVFNEVALEYPTIQNDHYIIDIGAARLATDPERFDVIVTLNLYGDIISDIAAEVAGSVGLAGSANIGTSFSMFEAIHGSAPDIAGKNIANPSALIMGSVMMLLHLGLAKEATQIQNALLKTLEEGYHTGDIFEEGVSKKKVSTKEFTEQILLNLGQKPKILAEVNFATEKKVDIKLKDRAKEKKDLVGVDVFVDWSKDADLLAAKIKDFKIGLLSLKMITNRGLKVWPDTNPDTIYTDHWRCRFEVSSGVLKHEDVIKLLGFFNEQQIDFIKTEHLYNFSGVHGYSMGQGQ
jgi:isocitrate dehydrogenase